MLSALNRRSPVLEKLAELYAESEAGRTGLAKNGFCIRYGNLLELACCTTGERYANAEQDLRWGDGTVLHLKRRRNLALNQPSLVRVRAEHEAELFAVVGRVSPTDERAAWARFFAGAASWSVPAWYRTSWLELCRRRSEHVLVGRGWKPFHRKQRQRAEKQLEFAAKLLGWTQRCLIRTASAQLTGSSKFFEHCTGTMETLLKEGSGGKVQSLLDLNIEPNPATVRFHGPILVHLPHAIKDYHGFEGESALSEIDIAAATAIETSAPRCVTIENGTTFYELCRLRCTDLLIFTSYPNQATVDFLGRLPAELPLFHFGDTDPWGFDVLRDLRRSSGREIKPLHMHFRNWAETLPPETRSRRLLTPKDRQRLAKLLEEPCLIDVHEELRLMDALDSTGDFEQEGLMPLSNKFPYIYSTIT